MYICRALLTVLAFLIGGYQTTPASEIEDGAKYLGRSANTFNEFGYSFGAQKRITQPPVQEYRLRGRLLIVNIETKARVDASIQATLNESTGDVKGRVQYVENGAFARFPIEGFYNPERDTFLLVAHSGTFGKFTLLASRDVVDLSGIWDFVNDPAGNMTITRRKFTTVFTGKYQGTGAHSKLVGTLKGIVRSRPDSGDTWEGSFHLTELGNVVDGRLDCNIKSSTAMTCFFNNGPPAGIELSKISPLER
jgi:hypothetical protein